MAGKPDASLTETTRMGSIVAERLLKVSGVASVAQQAGRADLSEDTWGTNISEIWVALDGQADYNRVRSKVRESLDDLIGFDFQIKPFLRERVDEVLTGTTADIAIRVVGPDLQQLRAAANRIAAVLGDVRGIADLRVEQVVDVPQVDILLRPADVARYGLSVGHLNGTLQTLLQGTTVGQVHEQDRVFDVIVHAGPVLRTQPANVRELLIDLPPHEPTRTESTTCAVWPTQPQRTEKIPLRALADMAVMRRRLQTLHGE